LPKSDQYAHIERYWEVKTPYRSKNRVFSAGGLAWINCVDHSGMPKVLMRKRKACVFLFFNSCPFKHSSMVTREKQKAALKSGLLHLSRSRADLFILSIKINKLYFDVL